MTEDWKSRWNEGRIGWHEVNGNRALHEYWPIPGKGERVLVPLCGKSPDLLWLAQNGYDVTGVELSEIAIHAFIDESGLDFAPGNSGELISFSSTSPPITLICGDYFKFQSEPFDALYDRASLIALPRPSRPDYVRHTRTLMKPGAAQLLITLEYDQEKADGPPYSVQADEVIEYWSDLRRVAGTNAIDSTPPKFRAAGLTEVIESVWKTGS